MSVQPGEYQRYTALMERIATLEQRVATLEQANATFQQENANLKQENANLKQELRNQAMINERRRLNSSKKIEERSEYLSFFLITFAGQIGAFIVICLCFASPLILKFVTGAIDKREEMKAYAIEERTENRSLENLTARTLEPSTQ